MKLRHLFGIASVLMVAWLAFGIWKSGRKLKSDNLIYVETGTTLEQVESLLGGPAGSYGYSRGSLVSGLGINRPNRNLATQFWEDKKTIIFVQFDENKRVRRYLIGYKNCCNMEIEDNYSFTDKIWRSITDSLGL